MLKTKKKALLLLVLFCYTFTTAVSVLAASSFTMDRRVVNGYENVTHTYNSTVTKTIKCKASYDYSTKPSNATRNNSHNKLSVEVYQQYKNWYGATKWESYAGAYECSYLLSNFSLSKSITLQPGTYGFKIWRALDDTYSDNNGKTVGYMRINDSINFE